MGEFFKSYVEVEYKEKKLKFYPLNNEDTFAFLEKWGGTPQEFLSKNEDFLKELIAKSLKINKKELQDISPGFLMFGLENLMEAIDFPFLLRSSQRLTKKMLEILKDLEKDGSVDLTSLPVSSQSSAEKKDGQSNIFSEGSQPSKQ